MKLFNKPNWILVAMGVLLANMQLATALVVKQDGKCLLMAGQPCKGLTLTTVDFKGLNLNGANFEGSTFASNASFRGTDLRRVIFKGVKMKGAAFFGAVADGADFSELTGSEWMQFDTMKGWGAIFKKAILIGASFNGADIRRGDFEGVEIQSHLKRGKSDAAILVDWQAFTAKKAYFANSNMSKMRVNEGIFEEADLSQVDFSNAFLQKAQFKNANLQQANFSCADLTGADFTGADLKGAKFFNAILTDVIIDNAELEGARVFCNTLLTSGMYTDSALDALIDCNVSCTTAPKPGP